MIELENPAFGDRWPGGIIPFTFDRSCQGATRNKFRQVIADVRKHTCILFSELDRKAAEAAAKANEEVFAASMHVCHFYGSD